MLLFFSVQINNLHILFIRQLRKAIKFQTIPDVDWLNYMITNIRTYALFIYLYFSCAHHCFHLVLRLETHVEGMLKQKKPTLIYQNNDTFGRYMCRIRFHFVSISNPIRINSLITKRKIANSPQYKISPIECKWCVPRNYCGWKKMGNFNKNEFGKKSFVAFTY